MAITPGPDIEEFPIQTAEVDDNASEIIAALGLGASALKPALFLYATDYGVTADGVTDDTEAMQDALDALRDSAVFAELVLPIGVISISDELVLSVQYGCRVRGFGPERTKIVQSSTSANGIQYRHLAGEDTTYIEFLELCDFSIEGPGLVTSSGIGINMHDDSLSSEFFNGGALLLDNIKVGNNGVGFDTGIYIKRWDGSLITRCRVVYNYRNLYLEAFTKTVNLVACGFSQAEGINVRLGPNAKVNMVGCDNGNSPQWVRVGYGSSLTVIGSNYESQIYSTSASRRHNFATTTYPGVSTVSGVNTTTGLFTTSGNHGLKPGVAVHFGYATLPTGLAVAELYEVIADGITATTFKVAPVFRAGTVTSGSPNITVSGTRTNTDDLTVGGKVYITTGTTLGDFTPGEYWIVGKPSASTLTISDTEGGTALNFPANGSVGVRPTTALIPSTSGASVTVFCPSFALEHSSVLTTTDSTLLATGGSAISAPAASLGTGCAFYTGGVWTASGYTGTFGGRVVVLGTNALIEGRGIPVTNKLSTDALTTDFTTGNFLVYNEDSGLTATAARRNQYLALLCRATQVANDRLFWQCRDRHGNYSNEPMLNRDARITTAIASGTVATPFELKPNTRYRLDFAAAAATIRLNLPDDSTAGEVLAVDDEIEIYVVNSNSQTVQVNQVGTQTIRVGSTVTTSGSGFGLTLATGDKVLLKCTSVAGVGNWQVISVVGTPGTY